MKLFLSILVLFSALLADRDGGPYVGFGYGLSTLSSDEVYAEDVSDDSEAMLFYAGAYINKNFSVEINYIDFNIGDAYSVVDENSTIQTINFQSYNVSTLAHYAFFDDILDFYAKFGVGKMSSNNDGFTMLFGAGTGIRFSDMFSFKLAYDRYMIDYNSKSVEREINIDLLYCAFEIQF